MTAETFARVTGHVGYMPRGIYFSELFLFLGACVQAGVNLLIESGVKHGVSTRVLATTGLPVIAVDYGHFDVGPVDGVRFVRGDGCAEVPRLAKMHDGDRLGILIDGPKREQGRALKDACLALPCVRVVACHDSPPGLGETLHSHDPQFRETFGFLDDRIPATALAIRPNGSGLGVWVKS